MHICICEDNAMERKYLYKLLTREIEKRSWDCRISQFSCGSDFINSLDQEEYDLVFMDIFLGDCSGVDAAAKLKEKDSEVSLIFTTNSPDFYKDGFDVGALHYLLKPVKPEELSEALNRCARLVGSASRMLTVMSHGVERKIAIPQIMYIEVLNKSCTIYTTSEAFAVNLPLKQLIEQIDSPQILQCHRSFCINLAFVSGFISNFTLQMSDNTEIPVSRDRKTEIKNKIDEFRA